MIERARSCLERLGEEFFMADLGIGALSALDTYFFRCLFSPADIVKTHGRKPRKRQAETQESTEIGAFLNL